MGLYVPARTPLRPTVQNTPLSFPRFQAVRWILLLLSIFAPNESAFSIEATYRYFRFDPRDLRDSPTTANSVQVSEFRFQSHGQDVSMAGVVVTNPDGNSPAAEGPEKVIDGDTATKWLDFNKSALVFTFPAPVTVDSYTFATANDSPERDPVGWRLEASLDGSSWRRLDEVRDYEAPTTRFHFQPWFNLPATGFVPGDPVSPLWDPREILSWSPENDPDAPYNRSTVPLANRIPAIAALKANPHARLNEGRVMPLIAFNSTPAASAQGSRTLRYHTPLFWQYMHQMTFWGASDRDSRTILAPSAHVVDAAHRNGVPVLGKIFFAFSSEPDRLAKVRQFLVKSGSNFPVADKLIEVARYYGFDGWFINQETSGTDATDSQNMRDFIKYFRARAPELEIMWYDAMVENGARSFQNALTTQNDAFMKEGTALVSHSMFLNFWWGSFFGDSTKMPNSRQLALQLGIDPYDIYAGIDTEGGGYHTNVDWTSLFPEGQPHRLSLGIYRPEWTFNSTSNPTDFHTRDLRYWVGPNGDPSNTTTAEAWKGIAHYIPEASPISSLPFVTNFNVGQGTRYAVLGSMRTASHWTNLSLQDVLPTYRWIIESDGTKLKPTIDLSDAYEGGATLRVTGDLNSPNLLRLYRCNLLIETPNIFRIVYKRGVAAPSAMRVGLSFEDSPTTRTFLDVGAATTSGWNSKEFSLSEYAGRKLVEISLQFTGAPVASYDVRVGQIAVLNGTASAPSAPSQVTVERKESIDVDTRSLRLRWTHSVGAVHHYDVFYVDRNGGRTWLGATPNNVYFVPALRRQQFDNLLNIEVVAVSPSFGRSQAAGITLPMPAAPVLPSLYRITGGSIIGTTGSYQNNGRTRNLVFDGNSSTYFDGPTADGVWAGLDTLAGRERVITAVQFQPRTGWTERMIGGVFQASDTADFSGNVVTLASIPLRPPEGITSIVVNDTRRWRYVRYLSPDGSFGNVAEVAFFGVPLASAPLGLAGNLRDGKATLTWSASLYATAYEVKRASSIDGPYTVVAAKHEGTTFTETGLDATGTHYYVVAPLNLAGKGAETSPVRVTDGYRQWAAAQGWNPQDPLSGFAEDADRDGLQNGVEYAAPAGLQITTAGGLSTLTVELRALTEDSVILQRTTDLQTWEPISLTLAPVQTGVPAGFARWTATVPLGPSPEKRFYQLKVTR